jgi:hypothetical protein
MAEKNASHIQHSSARASVNGQTDSDLATLDRRLAHLRNLNENWDTYGGLPPSESAIEQTRQLLSAVATTATARTGRSSLPPVIAPTSDGGILLEWTTEHTDLEVEISEAGLLHTLQTRRNADGEQYDEREDLTVSEVVNLVASIIGS